MDEIDSLNRVLIKYLRYYQHKNGILGLKEECLKILNKEDIKALKDYSKDDLALTLEKNIMISSQLNDNTFWNRANINEPLVLSSKHNLEGRISLFIRDLYRIYPKDKTLDLIKNFYDNKILENRKKNILLPNGISINIDEMYTAVINCIEGINNLKDNYKVSKTVKKIQKVTYISSVILTLAVAISSLRAKNEVEEPVQESVAVNTNDLLSDFSIKNAGIEIQGFVEQLPNEVIAEFVGYDNGCPIEYQEYMYEMSKKYDVPFNVLITIADNESGGLFNTNGIVSSTADYGFMQINKCNKDIIKEQLGYTLEDLQNNPYASIEAAAFLLKDICNRNKIDIKNNNYLNVFGMYNGWEGWHKKSISVDYAHKAMDKVLEQYNKKDEDLFIEYEISIDEYGKEETHGKSV